MISRKKIIYAADLDSFESSVKMIKKVKEFIGFVKVTANSILWENFIDFRRLIKSWDLGLFIDLKTFDIPNTVSLTIKRCCEIGADIATIHGTMSEEAILSACNARGKNKLKIFAVTVLTSENSSEEKVLAIANKCKKLGVDGVICSVGEVKSIKRKLGKDFLTITPGVRIIREPIIGDDQKRLYYLEDAIEQGSDFIVLGRAINTSGEIVHLLKSLIA